MKIKNVILKIFCNDTPLDPMCKRVSNYLVNLDLEEIDLRFLQTYIYLKEKRNIRISCLKKILLILGWRESPEYRQRSFFLRPAAPRSGLLKNVKRGLSLLKGVPSEQTTPHFLFHARGLF